MRRLIPLFVGLVLVLAACGGGDESGTTTSVASAPGDDTSAPTDTGQDGGPEPTDAPDPGSGSSTDFCRFVADFDQEPITDLGATLDEEEIRAQFSGLLDRLDEAKDMAPAEIADDVAMFTGAFRGFVELLEEYEYDFFALASQAGDDPRLNAFDEQALEESSNRIASFCGIAVDDGGDQSDPGAPSGDVTIGGDLPEDLPSELVPPGDLSDINSVDAGGSISLSLMTSAGYDDVVDHYTALLGDPVSQLQEAGAETSVWIGQVDGADATVSVVSTDPVGVGIGFFTG